jgi:hypothetical protein
LNGSSSYGHNGKNFDENLPIINKTKHSTKGEKKVQDRRTQVLTNQKSFQEGRPLEE